MSYSCSDFADDVLAEFVRLDLVKEADIESDDPSQQAGLVLAGLKKLRTQRAALLAALERVANVADTARSLLWHANRTEARRFADDAKICRAAIAKARG